MDTQQPKRAAPVKRCRTCGEIKSLTEYHVAKKNRDGLRSDCNTCRLEYQREYVQKHPEKVRAYRKRHYQENKARISEAQRDWYLNNKERRSATSARWYAENKDKAALSNRLRKLRGYGLTIDDYEQILEEQEWICPICLDSLPANTTACVDHCHETGKVRGLLHTKCNASMGGLGDDPVVLRRAAAYLESA